MESRERRGGLILGGCTRRNLVTHRRGNFKELDFFLGRILSVNFQWKRERKACQVTDLDGVLTTDHSP